MPFYSTGCITIDPNNNESIWLGTGENVGGRHVGIGHGIYHSTDGGKSWKNKGLKESEHLSKIIVHPTIPIRFGLPHKAPYGVLVVKEAYTKQLMAAKHGKTL